MRRERERERKKEKKKRGEWEMKRERLLSHLRGPKRTRKAIALQKFKQTIKHHEQSPKLNIISTFRKVVTCDLGPIIDFASTRREQCMGCKELFLDDDDGLSRCVQRKRGGYY